MYIYIMNPELEAEKKPDEVKEKYEQVYNYQEVS